MEIPTWTRVASGFLIRARALFDPSKGPFWFEQRPFSVRAKALFDSSKGVGALWSPLPLSAVGCPLSSVSW